MNRRPFHRSLRGKILAYVLAGSLAPVLVVGVVAYLSLADSVRRVDRSLEVSKDHLIDEVVGRNAVRTAGGVADEIDAYLRERMRDVMVWASTPTVVDAARAGYRLAEAQGLPLLEDAELEARLSATRSLNASPAADAFLKQQINLFPGFAEVFITEAHGYNVAVSNLTSDFIQSDESWWRRAWEKGMAVGQVKYDDSARTLAMDISTRIDDPQSGERLGVLKAILRVDRIQQVADEAAAYSGHAGREEGNDVPSGKNRYEVRVVTSEGLLLAETSTRHDSSRIMTPTVNVFAAGDPGEGEIQKSAVPSGFVMDETAVTALARTAGASFYQGVSGFEGFGWTVTVKQPTALALAPLSSLGDLHAVLSASANHVGRVLVAAVLLGGAGAAMLATILARGITRPLARLADASEGVSRGDSIASIDIRSDDEIGDLGASFERLVASIRFLMQEERTTETS